MWLRRMVEEMRNPLRTKKTMTAWWPKPVRKYRICNAKDLDCKCWKSTKKNVRRWPIITANAATARIKSKESEAAAESLRGIQANEMGEESTGRGPGSVSTDCVAISALQESSSAAGKQGPV